MTSSEHDEMVGYIWMTPHTYLPVMAAIAHATGARCLGLHYRRAPEHRFPGAVAAACISPWTDLCVTGPSADAAADPVVSGPALRMMARVYLGDADPHDPTASPLHADLAGFPPLQLHVGTRESLLDDARRFAQRSGAAETIDSHTTSEGNREEWTSADSE